MSEKTTDFYYFVPRADAIKVPHAPRDQAVRLYHASFHDGIWNLQVRAPMVLGRAKEGRDYIVATAAMRREDLIALRNAINVTLAEHPV